MNADEVWLQRVRLSAPASRATGKGRLDVERYLSRLPAAVIGQHLEETLFRVDWGWWKASVRPYLTSFSNLGITPTALLDLGCGDGLLTCFLAALYPDADVIALDNCKLCLRNTRTIAIRLGLPNLRIVEGDAAELGSIFAAQHFDVIVARSLVGRLIPCSRHSPELRSPSVASDARVANIARAVRWVINPKRGLFLSTEGWAGAAELWCWASTLAGSKFEIDWAATESLRRSGVRNVRSIMLVAQATSSPTQVSLGDVLASLAGGELEHLTHLPTLTGYTAEALFEALIRRELVFGFQATGSDVVLRRELYCIGQLLASYDYTDRQQRELCFWPRRTVSQLRKQLEEEAESLRARQWTVLRFVPKAENIHDSRGPT